MRQLILTPGVAAFLQKRDGTGRVLLTALLWIPAPGTIRIKLAFMLDAPKRPPNIGVVHAFSHCFISSFYTMVSKDCNPLDFKDCQAIVNLFEGELKMKVLITGRLPDAVLADIETRTKMARIAADNLLAGLSGQKPPNCLNWDTLCDKRPP